MDKISIVISLFVILESLNIIILYFFPTSKKGNGVGIFDAYEKSKKDPEVHDLIRYLINWVAGTKLIFIVLLIVIVITGSPLTKILSLIALILSIASFYWRLYPSIRSMDHKGQISPKGYSKSLFFMITFMIIAFSLLLIWELVL